MPYTIPTSTLREHLADAISTVDKTNKYALVTKQGKPVSALVNLDFLEDLLAKSSSEYLKEIRTAREQLKSGDFLNHDDIFGNL